MSSRIKTERQFNIPKAPARRRVPERRLKDPAFVSWLHRLECAVSGARDGLEASHVIMGRNRMGVKEDDSLCVPLRRDLHQGSNEALHHLTEPVFWNRHGIDVLSLARDLYALFKTGKATEALGRQIIRAHRAMGELRRNAGIAIFDEKFDPRKETP